MDASSKKFQQEQRTIQRMIVLYCNDNHGSARGALCPECRDLSEYAEARLMRCPFGEDKPVCSKCTVHCYKPEMRERVRAAMRYAGPRMALKDPASAVRHLVSKFTRKPPTLKRTDGSRRR